MQELKRNHKENNEICRTDYKQITCNSLGDADPFVVRGNGFMCTYWETGESENK